MKLFESILNSVLNENMGEAVVNPNNTSADVFTCKSKNGNVWVTAELDAEDLKKVAEIDPSLIKKKWAMVQLPANELQDPNSEGYQKIIHLCQVVSQLGKYGEINPEDVIKEAGFTSSQEITPERRKEVEQDEDALWDEYIKKFDDPRIQSLLQSMHTFMPLAGLDHKNTERNLHLILSQDTKRVAAGKPAATYVASPQIWRSMNRRIKSDAIPIYLWYKVDKGPASSADYDKAADKIYGNEKGKVLGGMTAGEKLTDFKKGGTKTLGPARALDYAGKQIANKDGGFGFKPYYDVSDTELINGLEDKWNDPDRQGVVDNIRWIPTEASLSKVADDLGISVEELMRQQFGIDDAYALAVYDALKNILWIKDNNPLPTNQDGSVNMEFVRKQVFSLIVKYTSEDILKGMYANPAIRDEKAKMIACMYVGEHRIAPEMALDMFRRLDKEALNAKAEKIYYEYKAIYSKLSKTISGELNRISSDNTQVQAQKIMEESMMRNNNPMAQFYSEIDALMNQMGIHDDTENDGINLTNEERRLAEAKFYSVLNKMNNSNF